MTEPEWLTLEIVMDAHAEQLAIFGGGDGIRDRGLLESALARAPNKWAYGEARLSALAAAYGYGLSRNHGFVDGNKRIAFAAILMFLGLNGVRFSPGKADATVAMLALAAGEIDEDGLTQWIEDNIVV
ncbi:type II toxin-antitoxin system death-on-curing family toxin [Enterovirga rhinocerotis]|uniref:Death-on-curing protein n=1 Tax=Enterovirga rhinocerotis TaxID=1339210 RepID=A0A4R7BSW0_9HYPH|nr:type II toxin-antitoxin system death-on-curing family toxin [Enterovirga rhinocerotis]TDR87086.1 death-on-curing protein [Enterovirga rhinocerotis]